MTRGTMEGLCRIVQATGRVPQRHSFGRPPIPLQKQVLAFVWFISNPEVFWPWSATIFVKTRGSRESPGCLKDRKRHETGDKDEKSGNGTQIFHWEVSTRKMGLTFQEFCLFGKISSGTNQKVVFHLHPNRDFRNFLVNGKRSFTLFFQEGKNVCLNHRKPFLSGDAKKTSQQTCQRIQHRQQQNNSYHDLLDWDSSVRVQGLWSIRCF